MRARKTVLVGGVLGALVALLAAVIGSGASAGALLTPAAPPPPGSWAIRPDTDGTAPGHAIDEFISSFVVAKGSAAVTKLQGVTQHGVNRGCISGVRQ